MKLQDHFKNVHQSKWKGVAMLMPGAAEVGDSPNTCSGKASLLCKEVCVPPTTAIAAELPCVVQVLVEGLARAARRFAMTLTSSRGALAKLSAAEAQVLGLSSLPSSTIS